MRTTTEFLDAVKCLKELNSDYSLAPVLGITRSQVSRFRNGKDFLGDSTAIKIAELLEIDPAFVIACAHAERAKESTEKAVWQGLAARLLSPQLSDRICIMLSRAANISPGKIRGFFSPHPLHLMTIAH